MTDQASKQHPTTIYDLAQKAVKANGRQWSEDAVLFEIGQKRVYITRNNSELLLVYQERDAENLVRRSYQMRCSFLVGMTGWQFWLPRLDYENWVKRCKNGSAPSQQPRAQGGFLCPESRNWGKRWG